MHVIVNEYNTGFKYQTPGSAGLDLALNEQVTLNPGEVRLCSTGVKVALPVGTVGLVFPRSSLPLKKGLTLANSVGVIDCDYRGEIKVQLHNISDHPVVVSPGERVAQLVVMPCLQVNVEPVDELDVTERGTGGFGSTGA